MTGRARRALRAGTAVAALLLCACGGDDGGGGRIADDYDLRDDQVRERGGGDTTRFVVGSKDFEEQEILGEITLQTLKAAGAEVVDRVGLGSSEEVRRALESGEIDMYWEYTGTAALIYLGEGDVPTEPDELFGLVDELDRADNGIAWIARAPANNTYTLVARSEIYDQDNDSYDPDLGAVTEISDLNGLIQQQREKATICVGQEFSERADGLPGLEEAYGFEFPQAQVKVLPDEAVYPAVDKGAQCTFGSAFETNGLLGELGLESLGDDEQFFAAYNPSLTLRVDTLQRYPDLEPLFTDVAERLDTETLRLLSAQVLVDDRAPEDVARDWLEDEGLL